MTSKRIPDWRLRQLLHMFEKSWLMPRKVRGDSAEALRELRDRRIEVAPPYSKIDAAITKAFGWPWPPKVQRLYAEICDLFDLTPAAPKCSAATETDGARKE